MKKREHPLIIRILGDLLSEAPRRGEGPRETATRWLHETEAGCGLLDYLEQEAELLAMAANRLNILDDGEVRRIAREVGRAAGRLWQLVGTPAEKRL